MCAGSRRTSCRRGWSTSPPPACSTARSTVSCSASPACRMAYYLILAMLSDVPGRTLRMSDLAAVTQSSQSRLSHAVSRLERNGWVRRTPCPDDRRSTLAQLTDAGFAALAEAAPGHVPRRAQARVRPAQPPSRSTSCGRSSRPCWTGSPPRARCLCRRRADAGRVTPMGTLVLLRHGQSVWNAENLFTGWVDVPLSETGEQEARRGGELLRGRRPAARRRAHLAAAPGHRHRQPRARRLRPALDPGPPRLAAQRAPLRRAAGQGQEADPRDVRRGAVHALAPLVRRAAAADRARTRSSPRTATRATPTSAPTCPPPSASPTSSRGSCPTGSRRSCPTCRAGERRAARRARQLAARARQAPRRRLRRGHRGPEHPHRHPAALRPRRRPAPHRRRAAPTSTRTRRRTRSPRWPHRGADAGLPAPEPRERRVNDGRTLPICGVTAVTVGRGGGAGLPTMAS